MNALRCGYHLILGLLLSIPWLYAAFPSGLTAGADNSLQGWEAAFLLILFLSVRAAQFTQNRVDDSWPDEHRFVSLLEIIAPYFVETLVYVVNTVVLVGMCFCGPDARRETALLLALCTLAFLLAPVCAVTLGWKLSSSKLHAPIPILALGSLVIATVPLSYAVDQRSFPLVQVGLLVVAALVFLLHCCNSSPRWLVSKPLPEPAISLSCIVPCSCLIFVVPAVLSNGLAAIIVFTVGLVIAVSLACSLPYLFFFCFPWRPKLNIDGFTWCFLLGTMTSINLVHIVSVVVMEDRAPLLPEWSYWFLVGGLLSMCSMLCQGPESTTGPADVVQKTP